MNFQFQYPQALWALAAIPLFGILYMLNVRWKKRTAQKIGDPRLVKELFKTYSPNRFLVKFCLVALAFAFGCLALANPRKRGEATGEVRKGIDIMVALDVSNSMLANDIRPNRLTAAQELIRQLLERLPDDRIGLVLFAGSAYVQMPLTFDHEAAGIIVSAARPSAFRAQGTAIGEALEKCSFAFGEESGRFRSVIRISDGETHDENALESAKNLADNGIMVNTVGIGSTGGASITDTSGGIKKDLSGNVVVSKLNEQLLQQMATTTNGRYVYLNNTAEAISGLMQQLEQIQKRALGDISHFNYETLYMWLALPALLLMVSELFFPDRKRKSL